MGASYLTRARRDGLLLLVILAQSLYLAAEVRATPENISRGELALLPAYCPDSQTFGLNGFPENPHPRQRPWVAQMGRAFWAIHHYCWAMIAANRAKRTGMAPEQRKFLYQSAINDSHYVLDNSQPGFVLLPEIFLRMGEFAIGAEDPGRALEFFERSYTERPDYWPAYLALARLQAKLGRKQEALAVLETGLKAVPDQPDLKRTVVELSGAGAAANKPSRKP